MTKIMTEPNPQYIEACKQACPEGCGKQKAAFFIDGEDSHRAHSNGYISGILQHFPCTAPSYDLWVAQKLKELAEAKLKITELEIRAQYTLEKELRPLWKVITNFVWDRNPQQLLGMGGEYARALQEELDALRKERA